MDKGKIDLHWMRVFVEAARSGSFSSAATVLGLTQPAVSYQIRRLEEQAGFVVLHRRHQGVELTAAGRRLFEIAERTVTEIDAMMRERAASLEHPIVRLRTDYAFSSYWLIPRMYALRQRYPEIDLQIVATQRFDPGDMEDTDVAVIFADQATFGPDATMLVAEEVVPVCTPAFLNELGDAASEPSRLVGERLINLDAASRAPWFDWPQYFEKFGLARNSGDRRGDLSFNTFSLVIQAVLENQGVALGWMGLIDPLLRSHVLVPAGPVVRAPERGYLLLPPRTRHSNGDRFLAWIKEEAGLGTEAISTTV